MNLPVNIIKELVELKIMKDEFGKNSDYLKRQPKAWENAKKFLKSGTFTSYKDFIFNNLVLPTEVNLIRRIKTGPDKFEILHLEMGLNSTIDVEITHLNTYSRSFEFEIKFDEYVQVFLFYINDKNGPSIIFDKFHAKIYDIVNSMIIKNERWDILVNADSRAQADFARKINKSNFKNF